MKNKLLIIAALAFLIGCNQTTTMTRGEELIWTVESKPDAIVTYKIDKDGAEEITVNNQGAPSTLDKIMEVLMLKTAVNASDD